MSVLTLFLKTLLSFSIQDEVQILSWAPEGLCSSLLPHLSPPPSIIRVL